MQYSEMPITNQVRTLSFSGIRRPESQESQTRATAQPVSDQTNRLRGFTIVEVAVVITIILILACHHDSERYYVSEFLSFVI